MKDYFYTRGKSKTITVNYIPLSPYAHSQKQPIPRALHISSITAKLDISSGTVVTLVFERNKVAFVSFILTVELMLVKTRMEKKLTCTVRIDYTCMSERY